MVVFVRNKGEKNYHRANGGECPSRYPRNGWKKGQKYTNFGGDVYIVDSVDAVKGGQEVGQLRLHVTKIKDRFEKTK